MAFGCSKCNALLKSKWLCVENAHTSSSKKEFFIVLATFASFLLESFNFLFKGCWHYVDQCPNPPKLKQFILIFNFLMYSLSHLCCSNLELIPISRGVPTKRAEHVKDFCSSPLPSPCIFVKCSYLNNRVMRPLIV
jgi:hypothetical protein